MNKKGKMMVMAMASAMMMQATPVMANEALEELNTILTEQLQQTQESLLSETLGLSDLKEAIKTNGIALQWNAGLMDGTAELTGLTDIPEGSYAQLGVYLDKTNQNWKVDAGFGALDGALGDLTLYGEHDMLQLAIPQLYEGAITVHAGNLKEQYDASALSLLFGEQYSAMIPDIDMKFYPEATDLELFDSLSAGFSKVLLEELTEFQQQINVEKREEQDSLIYTMTYPSEAVQELYTSFFDSYIGLFSRLGMVNVTEISEWETEIDQMLDELFTMMPEEIDVNFYVKNDLVEKISYEMYLDTAAMAGASDMMSEEEQQEEAVIEVSDAGKLENFTLFYEFTFTDPTNLGAGMDMRMQMIEETGVSGEILLQIANVTEESTASMTITAEVSAKDETIYSGTVFKQTFDAATGDFDIIVAEGMFDETDTQEELSLTLDSIFTQIEAGKGFTWKIDEFSFGSDSEKIGITSEVTVNSQPEAIEALPMERNIFEMDETELYDLILEISENAQNFIALSEGEVMAGSEDELAELELAG